MIKALVKRILATKQCNLCHHKIYQFTPISEEYVKNLAGKGFPLAIDNFETLNYKGYKCPYCEANDRDRLIGLYFAEKILQTRRDPWRILDIAPSSPVRSFIQRQAGIRYRSADLYMDDVDDNVDIQDMFIYRDKTFDIVICSHVLEHIPDDVKALKEMYRVLKEHGRCILLVPIPVGDSGFDEDLGQLTPEERERRFGQDDHVRLYDKATFEKRIREGGFELEKLTIGDFKAGSFEKNGISGRSVLYIGKKSTKGS
jgi:SAM-dependent methyltransferase